MSSLPSFLPAQISHSHLEVPVIQASLAASQHPSAACVVLSRRRFIPPWLPREGRKG